MSDHSKVLLELGNRVSYLIRMVEEHDSAITELKRSSIVEAGLCLEAVAGKVGQETKDRKCILIAGHSGPHCWWGTEDEP